MYWRELNPWYYLSGQYWRELEQENIRISNELLEQSQKHEEDRIAKEQRAALEKQARFWHTAGYLHYTASEIEAGRGSLADYTKAVLDYLTVRLEK